MKPTKIAPYPYGPYVKHLDRFIAGTAANVEAEYGFKAPFDGAFVLVQLYDDEPVTIEDFTTVKGLTYALKDIEDRSSIEWFL